LSYYQSATSWFAPCVTLPDTSNEVACSLWRVAFRPIQGASSILFAPFKALVLFYSQRLLPCLSPHSRRFFYSIHNVFFLESPFAPFKALVLFYSQRLLPRLSADHCTHNPNPQGFFSSLLGLPGGPSENRTDTDTDFDCSVTKQMIHSKPVGVNLNAMCFCNQRTYI
jgi:hypothetical protein